MIDLEYLDAANSGHAIGPRVQTGPKNEHLLDGRDLSGDQLVDETGSDHHSGARAGPTRIDELFHRAKKRREPSDLGDEPELRRQEMDGQSIVGDPFGGRSSGIERPKESVVLRSSA
jgi:hypothetical protein